MKRNPMHSSLETWPSPFPYWRTLRASGKPRKSNQGSGPHLQRNMWHLGAPPSLILKGEQLHQSSHFYNQIRPLHFFLFSLCSYPRTKGLGNFQCSTAHKPPLPHSHLHCRKICNVSAFLEQELPIQFHTSCLGVLRRTTGFVDDPTRTGPRRIRPTEGGSKERAGEG